MKIVTIVRYSHSGEKKNDAKNCVGFRANFEIQKLTSNRASVFRTNLQSFLFETCKENYHSRRMVTRKISSHKDSILGGQFSKKALRLLVKVSRSYVLWAPSHWGKHLEFGQFLILKLFHFQGFTKNFHRKICPSSGNSLT